MAAPPAGAFGVVGGSTDPPPGVSNFNMGAMGGGAPGQMVGYVSNPNAGMMQSNMGFHGGFTAPLVPVSQNMMMPNQHGFQSVQPCQPSIRPHEDSSVVVPSHQNSIPNVYHARNNRSVHDFYHIGTTLGKGSFAVVKEAQHKHTGVRVAIKMIDRSNPAFDADALRKEIATMHRINHRNCIRLHEVFEEQGYICLVLDLVTGGELFDRIIARGHYSEKDAAEVSRDVLQAVAYLHAQGIVHRDLKPENLLYMSNDESMPEYKHIKVADFGLARCGSPDSPMRTMCGTPGYVAPEVLDPRLTAPHGYGPQIDIWSIGVVLYIMLCGFPPFYSENTVTLFRQIRRGDYSFPSPYWDNISDLAKDLVRRMLVVDPKQRLTAQQCLEHQWIVNASSQEDKSLGAQHKAFLLIRRLPLFEQVDPSCLSEVTRRLKRVTVKANEYVIRSGDEGKCMYFVGSTPQQTIGSGVHLGEDIAHGIQRSKCLSVLVDGQEVTCLGTGDYFGEVALVSRSDHKRTADVQALCTCELFELSREDVSTVIKSFPILEARLQSMAEARLRRAQSSYSCSNGSNGSTNSLLGSENPGEMQRINMSRASMESNGSTNSLQSFDINEPAHAEGSEATSHVQSYLPLLQDPNAPQTSPVLQALPGMPFQNQPYAFQAGSQRQPMQQYQQVQLSAHGQVPGQNSAPQRRPQDLRADAAKNKKRPKSQRRSKGGEYSNPADRAQQLKHLYQKQPSMAYLAHPEAVPRIDGILRMNSRIGILDHVDITFGFERSDMEGSVYGQDVGSSSMPAANMAGIQALGGGMLGVNAPHPQDRSMSPGIHCLPASYGIGLAATGVPTMNLGEGTATMSTVRFEDEVRGSEDRDNKRQRTTGPGGSRN